MFTFLFYIHGNLRDDKSKIVINDLMGNETVSCCKIKLLCKVIKRGD